MINKQEVDQQLALFKEGEKLAYYSKINPPFTFDDVAWRIADCINGRLSYNTEEENIRIIKDIIKVYQGFLDNGGQIDFTKE